MGLNLLVLPDFSTPEQVFGKAHTTGQRSQQSITQLQVFFEVVKMIVHQVLSLKIIITIS